MDGYADDPTIRDDAVLWRRIPPWHLIFDANLRRWRPKSAAFEDHPNGTPMSVYLADMMEATGRGPDDALTGHQAFALAGISAGLARSTGQQVAREPLPGEPAHAVVVGRKTKSVSRRFAKESHWVVSPLEPQVRSEARRTSQ